MHAGTHARKAGASTPCVSRGRGVDVGRARGGVLAEPPQRGPVTDRSHRCRDRLARLGGRLRTGPHDWDLTTALPNGPAGLFPAQPRHIDLRWPGTHALATK